MEQSGVNGQRIAESDAPHQVCVAVGRREKRHKPRNLAHLFTD
jgi:hypothetical protein